MEELRNLSHHELAKAAAVALLEDLRDLPH
jgi:hypothetical protein